jgi:hypothetical protein
MTFLGGERWAGDRRAGETLLLKSLDYFSVQELSVTRCHPPGSCVLSLQNRILAAGKSDGIVPEGWRSRKE